MVNHRNSQFKPTLLSGTDHHGIIVTNPSVDSGSGELDEDKKPTEHEVGRLLSTSEEGGKNFEFSTT